MIISDLYDLKDFSSLLKKTEITINNMEESSQHNYFASRKDALSVVYDGYKVLPKQYNDVFLDPLKNLMEEHYESITSWIQTRKIRNIEDNDSPFREWLD